MKTWCPSTTRMAIGFLGTSLWIMLIGGGVMNWEGRELAPKFYEIITLIVMGMVGLLKTGDTAERPAGTKADPIATTNENSPASPLPIKDTE